MPMLSDAGEGELEWGGLPVVQRCADSSIAANLDVDSCGEHFSWDGRPGYEFTWCRGFRDAPCPELRPPTLRMPVPDGNVSTSLRQASPSARPDNVEMDRS